MLIGAHVSSAGGPLPALERGAAIGADVIQVHIGSPRVWRQPAYGHDVLAGVAGAVASHAKVRGIFCHASYLINLGTGDRVLREKSLGCLVSNLEVASRIGSCGLVLHIGSHLGAGLDEVLASVAGDLVSSLDAVSESLEKRCCPLLLENTAGAGGTIGRSFEELARVLEAAGGDDRLGVCLDTQHLFASGVTYETLEAADTAVSSLDRALGLERLFCLHVNDSKVPAGSNRDRHENLGEGAIGRRALGSLLGHPRLQDVPAILEVPGREKKGPRADDLATARAIHETGRRRWRAWLRATTPPPPPGLPPVTGGQRGSRRDPAHAGSPSQQER